MGTGTTALSALMEDRQYVGSEVSKEYHKLSKDRLKEEDVTKEIFLNQQAA